MRIRRPIAVSLGLAVAATAIAAAVVLAPRSAPGSAGPVVFYSLQDRGDSTLLSLRLDGRSSPRQVAVRRNGFDSAGTYLVDPRGVRILWARTGTSTTLQLVDSVDGSSRWSTTIEGSLDLPPAWSADGRFLFITTGQDQPGEPEGVRRGFAVDLDDRTTVTAVLPWLAQAVGFTPDGSAVVLAERLTDEQGRQPRWGFSRFDVRTGVTQAAGGQEAATDPRATIGREVSTIAGSAIDIVPVSDEGREPGERLVVRRLPAGLETELARVPTSYLRAAFLPNGRAIVAAVSGPEGADGINPSAIVLIDPNGGSRQVWAGSFPAYDIGMSAESDFLAVSGWVGRSVLTVIELSSTGAVEVPVPSGLDEAAIVRVVGGAELPKLSGPLPTLAPSATTSTEPRKPIEGATPLFATIDLAAGDGTNSTMVAVVAAAEGGGLAILDQLPPVPLAEGFAIQVIPDADGRRAAVIELNGEGVLRGWLWQPGTPATPLAIPRGSGGSLMAWLPDGGGLATSRDGDLVLIDLATGEMRSVPIPEWGDHGRWFTEPVGFTRDGRQAILAPGGACTDFCGFAYPAYVLLDIETGRFAEYDPGTDLDAISTNGYPPFASVLTGEFVWFRDPDHRSFELVRRIESAEPGRTVNWAVPDERPEEPAVWSMDGRRLWLMTTAGETARLVRLDAPLPPRPVPVEVGRWPADYRLMAVAPEERWAIGLRSGGVRGLVDLATGSVFDAPEGWSFVGFATGQ